MARVLAYLPLREHQSCCVLNKRCLALVGSSLDGAPSLTFGSLTSLDLAQRPHGRPLRAADAAALLPRCEPGLEALSLVDPRLGRAILSLSAALAALSARQLATLRELRCAGVRESAFACKLDDVVSALGACPVLVLLEVDVAVETVADFETLEALASENPKLRVRRVFWPVGDDQAEERGADLRRRMHTLCEAPHVEAVLETDEDVAEDVVLLGSPKTVGVESRRLYLHPAFTAALDAGGATQLTARAAGLAARLASPEAARLAARLTHLTVEHDYDTVDARDWELTQVVAEVCALSVERLPRLESLSFTQLPPNGTHERFDPPCLKNWGPLCAAVGLCPRLRSLALSGICVDGKGMTSLADAISAGCLPLGGGGGRRHTLHVLTCDHVTGHEWDAAFEAQCAAELERGGASAAQRWRKTEAPGAVAAVALALADAGLLELCFAPPARAWSSAPHRRPRPSGWAPEHVAALVAACTSPPPPPGSPRPRVLEHVTLPPTLVDASCDSDFRQEVAVAAAAGRLAAARARLAARGAEVHPPPGGPVV